MTDKVLSLASDPIANNYLCPHIHTYRYAYAQHMCVYMYINLYTYKPICKPLTTGASFLLESALTRLHSGKLAQYIRFFVSFFPLLFVTNFNSISFVKKLFQCFQLQNTFENV